MPAIARVPGEACL